MQAKSGNRRSAGTMACCQHAWWLKLTHALAVLVAMVVVVGGVGAGRTASAQITAGACCLPNGTCVFYNAVCECDVQGGQFFLTQPCSAVTCPNTAVAFGACCLSPSGCLYTAPSACATAGGTFFQGVACGVAATCPSLPAQPCCCGGVCYMTDPQYCFRVGGVTMTGTCSPNPCTPPPVGACCNTAGQCVLVPAASCPVPPNVSWTPASACLPGQCLPPGAGACCGPNGCVIIYNPCECIAKLGGPFFQGQTCNPDPCPPASPLGSCCIPSTVPGAFTCTTTSVTVCQQMNGIFTGNGGCNVPGGTCVPAAAACCCPITNTCHWIDPAQCALIGGTSGPVGVGCTPLTCAQPGSGACCNPATGICTIEPDPSHCPPPSVFYPGVTCANISCNPSFGACCNVATGTCFVGPQTQCAGPGFIWIAGANCVPNPCPTNGACCTPCTGACAVVPQSQCPTPGAWFGNQACTPTLCPQQPLFGACCLNGNCVQATSCDCIFKGGVFFGPNGTCNPAQCSTLQTGACCDPATQMCSVIAGPICNQIGGLFAAGTTCAPGGGFNCQGLPSQPAPACCCCQSCHDLLPAACALAGGVSQTGSSCQTFSCVPNSGACCDPATGQCTNVTSPNQCPAPAVFYLNQTCAQIVAQGLCPQVNPGKCCDLSTGVCISLPQSQCVPNLYLWIPSGVCTPTTCPTTGGACCDPLVGCYPVGIPSDCTGQFLGIGVPCVPSPCNLVCCDPASGACQPISAVGCPTGWTQVPGPTCNPNPCPQIGACCIPGTTICTQTTQAACQGIWMGPGTTCTPANMCIGTCCDPVTGACSTVFASTACPTGTTPIFGQTCNPNPCPVVCCDPNSGACQMLTAVGCPQGWNQIPGTCQPNPCPMLCCNPSTGLCISNLGPCPTGFIVATGLICNPLPCPSVGACCQPGAVSCVITTQANCSGQWLGANTSCQPDPCRGACCNPNTGGCALTTITTCLSNGGIWQGIGTVCPPTPPCPPPPVVICCNPTNGTCSVISGTQCPAPLVQSTATSCLPNPCPPVGPCCIQTAAGWTCITTTQPNCNGVWGPVGGTCQPNPCVGACCNPNTGACAVMSQQSCVQNGGNWLGLGTSCTPNQCPPVGPCCLTSTNQCIITTQALCAGVWGPAGGTCVPNPCKGACCNVLTGVCFITNFAGCSQPTQIYIPSGTCTPSPCPGACCNPATGICSIVPATQCAAPNQFLGNGVPCPPAPCVVGTCCLQNGQCLTLAQAQCLQIGGFWLGTGVPCTPTTCRGACCTTAGCILTGPLNCPAGSWQGPSTVCTPNPCPGACCKKTGACIITTQPNCVGSSVWQGAGTTCTPNPCLGACCTGQVFGGVGNTCIQTTQLQCLSILGGGQWQGLGVPCQSPPGNYTACCYANINGMNGVTVQDIFSFLVCWFNQQPCADCDNNNVITVNDLFCFLAAWFAGCQ